MEDLTDTQIDDFQLKVINVDFNISVRKGLAVCKLTFCVFDRGDVMLPIVSGELEK